MDIHSSDELVKQLLPTIDFATERAWEYAQRVGWDKNYPVFAFEGIALPLTREDIYKYYVRVVEKLYFGIAIYLSKNPINPKDRDRIYDSVADFTGAVTFSGEGPPEIRLGLLWAF